MRNRSIRDVGCAAAGPLRGRKPSVPGHKAVAELSRKWAEFTSCDRNFGQHAASSRGTSSPGKMTFDLPGELMSELVV